MSKNKQIINILPHGRTIETDSKLTLMESLLNNSIFLRSDCGGKAALITGIEFLLKEANLQSPKKISLQLLRTTICYNL